MSDDLEKILILYRDKFNMNFPIMLFNGMSDKELVAMINKAIKEEQPYNVEYIKNVIY